MARKVAVASPAVSRKQKVASRLLDEITRAILVYAVPFCLGTAIIGLCLGPIATRLAKWRESLERN